MRHHSITRLY